MCLFSEGFTMAQASEQQGPSTLGQKLINKETHVNNRHGLAQAAGSHMLSPRKRIKTLPQTHGVNLISPIGPLTISATDVHIIAITWGHAKDEQANHLLREARGQLKAYFEGTLKSFHLPLHLSGSTFQQDVCREMLKIPYGKTWTYGDIAKSLKSSAQPVGGACGRNKIPIIIPCHRVMGANEKMTGFSGAGGFETKRKLLQHEGWRPKEPDMFGPAG